MIQMIPAWTRRLFRPILGGPDAALQRMIEVALAAPESDAVLEGKPAPGEHFVTDGSEGRVGRTGDAERWNHRPPLGIRPAPWAATEGRGRRVAH